MAHTPLISVIVPVYNTLPYLGACLDSLLGQTLDDLEVICIDDGSTDGSAEMLDAYAGRDVRVKVTHQANAGVSAARNEGLDQAQGTYVLFVDSDDYIDRYACQKLANVAHRDHADIVIFGGETFPPVAWIDESMATIDAAYHEGGLDVLFHARGAYPLMCNKLYRRSLIEKGHHRFETSLSLGEDHAFQFCVFPHAQAVSSISDPIYHYRCERTDSAFTASRTNLVNRAEQYFAVVEHVLGSWQQAGLIEGNTERLASWLTVFLLQAVTPLDVGERAAFANRFQALVSAYGLEDALSADSASGSRARCIDAAGSDKPRIAVIVEPEHGVTIAPSRSLLTQELSQLEVFVVGGETPDELWLHDPRVRLVHSVREALEQAQAPWVLFASPTDEYEPFALRLMADLAEGGPEETDLVVVRDRGQSLRVDDLSRLLFALSSTGATREPPAMKTWIAAEDLPLAPTSLFSLDMANKLWSKPLAQKHFVSRHGLKEVASALEEVRVTCPDSAGFLTKAPLTELAEQKARELAYVFARELEEIRASYASAQDGQLAGIKDAALAIAAGTVERISDARIAWSFLRDFYTLTHRWLVVQDDTTWWPRNTHDYQLYLSGATADQTLLRTGRYQELCDAREGRRSAEQKLLQEMTWRTQSEESLSFRLGRTVTAAPRTIRDVLQGKQAPRHRNTGRTIMSTKPDAQTGVTMRAFWNRHADEHIAVSVLTPIYNVERYLPECLDSLKAQTLKNIEFICINDGSTDGSLDILKRYAENDPRFVIIDKPNSGYGASMNCGLDKARGEYIGIVESDDIASPDMFKSLYRYAHRRNLDIVKSNYYEHDDEGDTLQRFLDWFPYRKVMNVRDYPHITYCIPAIWAAIYRRQMLVDAGIRFNETPGASFQDTSFVFRCWAASKRVALLPDGYLRYRVNRNESSVKSDKKVFEVCGEYELSEQFLRADPHRLEEFGRYLQVAKYGTYHWNYNRISAEYQLEFAKRWADEYRAARDEGLLLEALFDPNDWALICELMEDPEGFVEAHPEF